MLSSCRRKVAVAVALAILAEIVAVRRGGSGQMRSHFV